MKNIIVVDAESALVKKNYENFRDAFNKLIDTMVSHWDFQLKQTFPDKTPYDYLQDHVTKPSPTDDVDDLVAIICNLLFDVATSEELTESLKANLRRIDYKSKNASYTLYSLMNPFTYADLHYLKMHNDLIFLFSAESPLEEVIIRISIQSIVESSTIRFIDLSSEIPNQLPLLKLVDLTKLYLVSWRPNFIKNHLIDSFENLEGFDISNRLIYYSNFNLPNKMGIQYNLEADSLKLQWSLISLDVLLEKLKIIQRIQSNPEMFKELVFVGIDFDKNTTQIILNAKLVNDHFPLVFVDYDIMYPRSMMAIDIYYGKISASLEYHKIQQGPKYIEALNNIIKNITLPDFNHGKKFFSINNIADYEIYLNRSKMSEIITKLISQPNFKNELHKKFPDNTLKFPKTLLFHNLDYAEVD